MSVEKLWNEICGKGEREKHREKSTQIPFRPPQNPHGVTETRTRDPSDRRRCLTAAPRGRLPGSTTIQKSELVIVVTDDSYYVCEEGM